MRGQSFQRGLRGKWTTAGRAGGHTLSSSLCRKSNGETSKASWKGVIQPNLHFTKCGVITYNGRECKKKRIYIFIYICITESLYCTPETNTTL